VLLHEEVVLLGDLLDARAALALRLLAQLGEDLLDVRDLLLRLLEMLLEPFASSPSLASSIIVGSFFTICCSAK
jgi:hypothetical protein